MFVTITARKTTLKDSFKEKVTKKLDKLDRFFDKDTTAQVTVTAEKDRETVEITILARGMTFRAEKTTPDRSDSLEAVVDSLTRQITKNKGRLAKRLRENAFEEVFTPEETALPPDDYTVVRTKHFPVKPMSVDEAVLQMNLIGHEFYMFLNDASEEINVVYRRKNGGYGLIEPEYGEE